MRNLICALFAFGVGATVLAEAPKLSPEDLKLLEASPTKLTKEQQAKRIELAHLRARIEEGGQLPYPGTPRGTIRFVNLQKKVPTKVINDAVNGFGSLRDYDWSVVESDCDASLKIKIIDDPAVPVVLVAPEDKWASVNVAKLGGEDVKPAFLEARTRKEIMRAFAFLTAGTSYDIPLYGAIRDVKRLDRLVESGLPVDVVMRTSKYLETMDVVPREMLNYRDLLVLGYDVKPKDEFQKAIYEEVGKTTKFTKKYP